VNTLCPDLEASRPWTTNSIRSSKWPSIWTLDVSTCWTLPATSGGTLFPPGSFPCYWTASAQDCVLGNAQPSVRDRRPTPDCFLGYFQPELSQLADERPSGRPSLLNALKRTRANRDRVGCVGGSPLLQQGERRFSVCARAQPAEVSFLAEAIRNWAGAPGSPKRTWAEVEMFRLLLLARPRSAQWIS
jgi:hypothetical protein